MRHLTLAALAATMCISPVAAQTPAAGATLKAVMKAADGADRGTVTFTEGASGVVHIIVEMTGMAAGTHGFHIHETGACDGADGFKSAGGHLSGGKAHGILNAEGPHAGDLPNVHVGPNGVVKVEIFTTALSLGSDGANALRDGDGSAVVVHAEPDDYQSDPAGHAGERIACGVIE